LTKSHAADGEGHVGSEDVRAFLAHLEQPDTVAPPPPVAGVGAWAQRRRWKRVLLPVAAVLTAVAVALGGYLAFGPGSNSKPPDNDNGHTPEQPKAWKPRTPEELAALPSPLDGRKRVQIPTTLLAFAGGGNPAAAPAELVARRSSGGTTRTRCMPWPTWA
jgi:hypothetical protein